MYKYIINPKTNKKVNINSKLGKSIVKQYLNFIIGGSNSETEDIVLPLPPHPRNDTMADLYDLHKDDDQVEKKLEEWTINKKPGDHNCIATKFNEDENCLEDPATFECIEKKDILQFPTGQCASKKRTCRDYIRRSYAGYNKNPFTALEENVHFWQIHCPPPPVLFYSLEDITIRMAVDMYRNNRGSCPPIHTWDVSRVTDMSGLFENFFDFNGNITNWNTSSVTNMSKMFSGADGFNQPLEWNTGNVENMSKMFSYAESFNQPLEWNTDNVTNMNAMFAAAIKFDQPLEWNTGNVTDMSQMFANAESFNQLLELNTENVTDMGSMFEGATSFNEHLNFTDTSNVKNMKHMFEGATSFNQPLEWDTENVEDMYCMFRAAISFNQPLEWDTKNVTNMSGMFQWAANFNQSLNFDIDDETNIQDMFEGSLGRLHVDEAYAEHMLSLSHLL